mgnify:CR=1 FL=1
MYENDMKIIERAQNGSKEDMTKLIEDNSRLVWSIVRRFNGRGYDIEDLYQIGSIGLIKAIQRFDTSFEVRLSTYAVPYILGEIKRFIRDDGPIKISRSIKELNIKIVINSHSPYFMRAVEVSLANYSLKDKGRFYVMNEDANGYFSTEDVTNNTDKIYEMLYKPLDYL